MILPVTDDLPLTHRILNKPRLKQCSNGSKYTASTYLNRDAAAGMMYTADTDYDEENHRMAELPENLPNPPPPPPGQGNQPYDSHEMQATSYPGYEEVMYGSPPTGHSGLGIASMAIGIISVLLGIIGMAIIANAITQHPNIQNIQPGEQPPKELIGIMGTIASLVCGRAVNRSKCLLCCRDESLS